jgi:KUP system potassium uptake protein
LRRSSSAKTPVSRLALGALGVVFGDIGTSPLYAFRTCFDDLHGTIPTPENVLGLLSLIFWAITIVISVKYMTIVLRADNHGEGGALALMALVSPGRFGATRTAVTVLGLLGAALFFSDGAITPAISVMSAVEGLELIDDDFGAVVVPLVLIVLLLLFSIQKRGTGRVGQLFGPLMLVWFVTLGVIGLAWIVRYPAVLAALDPTHALSFLARHRGEALIVLAAVFLAVTGGEALYADMGHFGPKPMRMAWFGLVMPALVLNYFGQGALVLAVPGTETSPFFYLVPTAAVVPLVLLATAATIVASQAVISGVFSVVQQAVQLGLLPRVLILHSSEEAAGQVYVPAANRLMLLATVGLVVGFGSSESLASAYGIAIALAMTIDGALVAAWLFLRREGRQWGLLGAICAALVVDLVFLLANGLKIPHGGWLPLAAAGGILLVMLTWQEGRLLVAGRVARRQMPVRQLVADLETGKLHRSPGTGVYLHADESAVPPAVQKQLETQSTLPRRIILMTVRTADEPFTDPRQRVSVHPLGDGLYRIAAVTGFMESPRVPDLLKEAGRAGVEFRPSETTYILGRDHPVIVRTAGMARWRKRLYTYLDRNAYFAAQHFGLPPERVVEIGGQVEI